MRDQKETRLSTLVSGGVLIYILYIFNSRGTSLRSLGYRTLPPIETTSDTNAGNGSDNAKQA